MTDATVPGSAPIATDQRFLGQGRGIAQKEREHHQDGERAPVMEEGEEPGGDKWRPIGDGSHPGLGVRTGAGGFGGSGWGYGH